MAFRIVHANGNRRVAIAVGLIALSVVLQWLSTHAWADPARTRVILEYLHLGRGPLLQALHVMALALLTTGLLPMGRTGRSVVCAAWAVCACLIEATQHPAVVDRLLQWTQTSPLPPRALDVTAGVLFNTRFAWSEIVASLLGGAVAWLLVRREVMR